MRLVLGLSALAASTKLTHGLRGLQAVETAYPKCTASSTKLFTDNLSAASSGCTDSIAYDWDGDSDPTDAQREELCACTVSALDVPKCYWTKMGMYNIPVMEHFKFVYDCSSSSGKETPTVTEVDAAATTPVPTTAAPGSAESNSTETVAECTTQQMSAFTTALNTASSGCMGGTSYNWGGSNNPTATQYSEICKCTAGSEFMIPTCSLQKGPDSVTLAEHYNWVVTTECPTFTSAGKASSSNVGTIVGIVVGVVVVVLIIGFVLWKRSRKSKQEQNPPQNGATALRSPDSYQPIGETPQMPKATSDPRPSGASTTMHTTISTMNGSMRPSGTGSYGTHASTRLTETGTWDDPMIVAIRIPHDTIYFGSLLSRGGFGEVYRGTYKGETVAIKQLLPERRKDLVQIDDFLGEVKLMSSLEHERIVKLIGVAWNSLSDACMVVEFMENGDLRAMLGRWDAEPERRMNGFDADKIKIALHIAHALVYLHSLQPVVVHRDLKSKNILLDANLDAKLTDFGISRERADATMTAGVGSSLWMAPEVMMGARYDEKADIFSFGVVLSELDTHQLPYFHAKVTETGQKLPEAAILQQVMLGRISVGFTDRANPDLVQLGRECVSLDPKARPTTAQVLYRVQQVMRQ